jgi:LAO/AO transport system kinase
VTKADLGRLAERARRDLHAALSSVGAADTPVVAVSSLAPVTGIDELIEALEGHRERVDLVERRLRARRGAALAEFAAEHGDRGMRALGGRRAALRWLAERDPGLDVPALTRALEERAQEAQE